MLESTEIKQKLAKIDADQRSIYDVAKEEGRSVLNTDEEQRFTKFEDEYSSLKKELQRIEALEERSKEITSVNGKELNQKEEEEERETPEAYEKRYTDSFDKYIRYGFGGLEKEERNILKSRIIRMDEKRAQSTANAAGGYLIPIGFSGEVEKSLKAFGGMLNVARVIPTTSGNTLYWPTVDDTANSGYILAEATGDATTAAVDVTTGQKQLDAYKYTSGLIKVSTELLEDEAIGFTELLGSLLGERLGRIANTHLTTGTGTSQPNGVVTASSKGADAASGAAIARGDLVNMVHGVDPAYRMNARFMFNDATLKAIKKLSFGSSDDRPLYIGGDARNGDPATIEGHAFSINQDMANIGLSAKSVLFGDFSKYVVRQVRGISVKRADERFIENDVVAFVGFARWDGELMNTAAVKHLLHPAT